MDTNYKALINEIKFLFNDVIKVNVLSHAKEFEGLSGDDYQSAVERTAEFAEEHLVSLVASDSFSFDGSGIVLPKSYKKAWKQLVADEILNMLIPKSYGGQSYPTAVKTAVLEVILRANPAFYLYLTLTLEVGKLIDQRGSEEMKEAYCDNLFKGEWVGAFCFSETQADCEWDAIETMAVEEGDSFQIKGVKSLVPAVSHDLASNMVYLVLARIADKDPKEEKLAWFVVPEKIESPAGLVDNNITVESVHQTVGLQATPFCTLELGKSGVTRGFLLCKAEKEILKFLNTMNGLKNLMTLQSAGLTGYAFQKVLDYATSESRTVRIPAKNKVNIHQTPLITYPHIADHIMYMKAVSEGIRAAVYSISFFEDCRAHGGSEQKRFFADLIELYTNVLKVRANNLGMEAVRRGVQVTGRSGFARDHQLSGIYQDLQANTCFGGAGDMVAQENLERMIKYKDGRLIQNLIQQFNSIDTQQCKSESMTEAVGVWQDYIGGIIVLIDDMKSEISASVNKDEVDPRLSILWANRLAALVGDVIICYHLISQGVEAEKKLEALGVNFFNLHQECSRNSEAMVWYDKLLAAEYFALNILSENEGNIRIIQRNASTALDAFFQ